VNPRVRTALIATPVVLAILFLGGKLVFALLVAVIAALGAREYLELAAPGTAGFEAVLVPVWSALVVLGFLGSSAALPGGILALGALVYFGIWIAGPGPTEETFRRWSAAAGAWVLVALFLGQLVRVRAVGMWPVFFLAAIVWSGDIAGYYVGSAFGRRLLAPKVSPKKTVEGALASVLAGAGVALLFALLTPVPHSPAGSLLLGIALNAAAQIGDLAESLLKRCAGVKDSGSLFPGHGGVLDRVDAFLLSAPLYALLLHS